MSRGKPQREAGADKRQFSRTEVAEQGFALFADGTRVTCIIHDTSHIEGAGGMGMRIELIDSPHERCPDGFWILMQSGRVTYYRPSWSEVL